ncbi:hypothetical protein BH23DEI1_BH23DEI1_07600 [soil metagenome]
MHLRAITSHAAAPATADAGPSTARRGEIAAVIAAAIVVMTVILAGHVAIDRGWLSWGPSAPIGFRAFTSALSLTVGVVMLAGYRGRRSPDSLIVGAAVFGVGVIQGARAIISVVGVQLADPAWYTVSIKMGWAQGVFLPTVLILGLMLVSARRRRSGERSAPRITFVLATLALGAAALLGPLLPGFPGGIVPDEVVARPAMAWPAALHLFLLSMIWRRPDVSNTPTGRWLTFAVYVGLLKHLLVAPFWSSAPLQAAASSSFNSTLDLLTILLIAIGAVRGMIATAQAEASAAERAAAQRREQARVEAELLRQAARLRRANEELGQYAYFASHDLQEPLRMITSYLQLVERRYRDVLDDEGREFMGFAVDGAHRMKRLVNDLLTYSQLGAEALDSGMHDANDALAAARRNLTVAIEDAGATITAEELPSVPLAEIELVQLFQNLVGNALKFARPGVPPVITVRAERTGAFWRFELTDNGRGIEKRYHDRAFAPFQRLERDEAVPGSGIGLALCRKIVARHDGRIWFDSVPGSGTTFYWTLPVEAPSSTMDGAGDHDGDLEHRVTTLIERARALT